MPDSIQVQQTEDDFLPGEKLILKWLIRRLAQRVMLTVGISWHRFRKIAGSNLHNNSANQLSEKKEMFPNKYSLKLLRVIAKDLDSVVQKRRGNYVRLLRAIDGIKRVRPLFPLLPNYVCPYALPLIVSEGRDVVSRQLNQSGVPASDWPDLPPEVLQKRDEHKIAVRLQEHILLLPVHQDLSDKQVEYMVLKLREFSGMREQFIL